MTVTTSEIIFAVRKLIPSLGCGGLAAFKSPSSNEALTSQHTPNHLPSAARRAALLPLPLLVGFSVSVHVVYCGAGPSSKSQPDMAATGNRRAAPACAPASRTAQSPQRQTH